MLSIITRTTLRKVLCSEWVLTATASFGCTIQAQRQKVSLASDPRAAVRAFHKIISLVFETILGAPLSQCRDLSRSIHQLGCLLSHPDGIASFGRGGAFSDLAGYYGAIEAQLRGSLHIHILLWILGFRRPEQLREFLAENWLAIQDRFWLWARATIFNSFEDLSAYLDCDAAALLTAACRHCH